MNRTAALADLADRLADLSSTIKTDGQTLDARAQEWTRGISAQAGGTGHASGPSDPTHVAATTAPDAAAQIAQRWTQGIVALLDACERTEVAIRQLTPQRTERQPANDLHVRNTRQGHCEICYEVDPDAHWHSGRPDDRLRPITHERTTMAEDPEQWLVCNSCRQAWARREPNTNPAAWRQLRVEQLAPPKTA